jgi:hypothetical protein
MIFYFVARGYCRAHVKQMGFVQQALALLSKQKLVPCNHALLRRRFSAHHTQ